MYPAHISSQELFRFRQLLGNRGKDKIEWNLWKYSYRKVKFQALVQTFKFLGFTKENNVLTSLGKRFVFGKEDNALLISLIQSEYFSLFKKLLDGEKSREEIFNALSLECDSTYPEKQRRSMLKVFLDLSETAKLLEIKQDSVVLRPEGINQIKTHSRIPLWVSYMPLFDESRRIERFKALYYETGHPFRDLVREAFLELGFKAEILPKKVSGIPDVQISMGDFRAVIETKGETKQIGENDVNQLTKAQSKVDFENTMLVFVGNAFRLKPPEQRGDSFHKDAIALAESKGITLLDSLTLIHSLQKKWKKELDLHLVIESLSKSGFCNKLF
jgi:hypothetical protein